jgi:hypothetical protein
MNYLLMTISITVETRDWEPAVELPLSIAPSHFDSFRTNGLPVLPFSLSASE